MTHTNYYWVWIQGGRANYVPGASSKVAVENFLCGKPVNFGTRIYAASAISVQKWHVGIKGTEQ